ncbi:MAG TPA: transcription antitermination factor NusB [Phycisphaerae bacterium]|nr:transcription antitermination factor NusB [Phycisphaerae bacterium]HPS53662.1 transcription antitermination factor NusB [Phycisphaerae bacterium]
MENGQNNSARDLAVKALRDRGGNVSAHLSRVADEIGLSSADRAFAHELAIGTLRRRATLDAILKSYLNMPGRKLNPPLQEIMQVALYQLLFLDRVPAFAAVNEAVRQAHAFRQKKQAGLINGVLRNIIREMSAPSEHALSPQPAANIIPISPTKDRRMERNVFPEPERNRALWLSAAYSLPAELAADWVGQFGWYEQVTAIAIHSCSRPPLIARVNSLKAKNADVLARLVAAGMDAKLHENGLSIVLDSVEGMNSLAEFQEGLLQPQDPTATSVVAAAKIRPGMRVLDFCASPGTKTTHIAERMENSGLIIAADVSGEKLKRIEENALRMGINIIKTIRAEDVGGLEPRSFDLVLADVPCSNSGVLARRVEARWRYSKADISKLVRDQQFLAQAAAQFVRPGGQLIYSTCSINPDENSRVVKFLAKNVSHLKLKFEKLTLPAGADDITRWHDGGYMAIFE